MQPTRVLFVCTGNICRSPTAEGVFRALAEAAGLADRIEADSCGTHEYHIGEPPDRRAIAHARARGYDIGGLRARQIDAADFTRFDWLIALDRGHQRLLMRMAPPASRDRIRLLLAFAAQGGGDVPDPYHGGPEAFERALDLIEAGARGLLDFLCRGAGEERHA